MACQRAIKLRSACRSASKSYLVLLLVGMLFMSFGFWILGLQRCKIISGRQGNFEISEDDGRKRYLYWGPGIDCPGKHCLQCGGLGHQESSLRCALEEALFLNRTFVLPSSMCISNKHSHVGLLSLTLHRTNNETGTSQTQDCPLDALYDLDLVSQTVPVISSNSREWQDVLKRDADHVHVEGFKRDRLKKDSLFSHATVINRTPNRLAWFTECKNRHNYSTIMLPYSFLPRMANPKLRAAADNIMLQILRGPAVLLQGSWESPKLLTSTSCPMNMVDGAKTFIIKKQLVDYDALHVRRGDKLKVRKDRLGVLRAMYAHLDHDTQPDHIIKRIENLIPDGRTLFIATDEMQPHFFDKLSSKYRIMRACNFSEVLSPLIQNNYQLFIIERMVLLGAKVLVKTWKENAGDISLSDEKKKKIQRWEPVIVTI